MTNLKDENNVKTIYIRLENFTNETKAKSIFNVINW